LREGVKRNETSSDKTRKVVIPVDKSPYLGNVVR